MTNAFNPAPHQGGRESLPSAAPNAALLIDFDNVTMGMRSDLSKELKSLLGSDIIRGKVTVQRAYADWRRYPQYIVPLSESSIDLIFAPAYGSNKKNATDIRMAIDGMELVFTRPEIGTFILLTGDSDFSSLVLKLKEYGKYVIGVGIQESSSDILVQNCDEYYSYTNLSGLRKTTETDRGPIDPWLLVEKAVQRMVERGDVMRSDRLKQVMLELDPGFDEGSFGFSKFSRFLTDASSRGLLHLKKLDNGQYEVGPAGKAVGARAAGGAGGGGRGRGGRGRSGGGARSTTSPATEARASVSSRGEPSGGTTLPASGPDLAQAGAGAGEKTSESSTSGGGGSDAPLKKAYALLREGMTRALDASNAGAVRDSDVKRKMLEIDAGFDEAELGFSKFSRFLRQAHDHGIVTLRKRETGNYEVSLLAEAGSTGADEGAGQETARDGRADDGSRAPAEATSPPSSGGTAAKGEKEAEAETLLGALGRRLGLRLGSPKRSGGEEASQPRKDRAVETPPSREPAPAAEVAASQRGERAPAPGQRSASRAGESRAGEAVDPSALGLPTDADARVRYLANSYKGVGTKTAESLVEGFGDDLFTVLQEQPDRVKDVIPPARAESVLDQWKVDFERRRSRLEEGEAEPTKEPAAGRARSPRERAPRGERARRGKTSSGASVARSGRERAATDAPLGDENGDLEKGESGARRAEHGGEREARRGHREAQGGAEAPATEPTAAPAREPAAARVGDAGNEVAAARSSELASEPAAGRSSEPSGEAAAERSSESGTATRTVGGVEIPEDAEPSRLRGRRSGRRGR